jgi:hypothetical protein
MKRPQLITRIQVQIQIKIQKLKNTSFDDFKMFNERFSIIHEFLVRVAVILGITTLLFFFLKEITTNKYVLTNIEVSRSIEDTKVDADKIYHTDLKQKIIRQMKNIMRNGEKVDDSISNDTNSFNIGGFDLNQLFLYFRSFFKMQNREIRAFLMKTEEGNKKYSVLLNIGNEEPIEEKFSSEKEITNFLAERILIYNSPYKLGLHFIEHEHYSQLEDVTAYLQSLADNEHWWERVFQNNNWIEKKKYLEMVAFCYNNKYLLNKSKIVNNPDEDACTCLYNDVISVNEDSRKRVEKLRTDSLEHINFMNDSIRLYNEAKADSVKKPIKTIREFKEKFKN